MRSKQVTRGGSASRVDGTLKSRRCSQYKMAKFVGTESTSVTLLTVAPHAKDEQTQIVPGKYCGPKIVGALFEA